MSEKIQDRCPYCSFQPESLSDYCSEHRPKLCEHPEVYPDGTCTTCGVLATTLPGKVEKYHRMVPRPKS